MEEKKLSEKDFLQLYKKLKDAEKEASLLREQNIKLKNEITSIKKDYEYMFKQIHRSQIDRKMQSMLEFKEKRIRFFDQALKRKDNEVNEMQNEVMTLLYLISNLNSSYLVKKLDNLGMQEFEKKKSILNIRQGDILLVKDPDITSEKVIAEIKDKVTSILYRKPVSKKIESKLPFVFIDANKLSIEENHYFGIINKEEFDKIKNKNNILHKIIEDYKKERA